MRASSAGRSPLAVEQATSAAAAATLRRLELTVSRRLDGLLHGEHLGLSPGGGTEPAESREYRPGEDDVRRMDWAVTARTTVPHMRTDVADRELETWVFLDLTPSMAFGTTVSPGAGLPGEASTPTEKRDLAVAALAALGVITARAGNRVGACLLTSAGLQQLPARSGRPGLLALLRSALRAFAHEQQPVAKPDLETALDEFARGLARQGRKAGLVAVVSDFLDGMPDGPGQLSDAVPAWELPLRRLATRTTTLAIEVLDPRELELPDVGMLAVVDPETGRRREIWTGSRRLRERYAAAAAEQRAVCAAAIRRSGAGYLQLRTDSDWVRDIARHCLRARRAPRPGVARSVP